VPIPVLSFENFIEYFKAIDICLNPISVDSDYFRGVKAKDFIQCKSQIKYLNAAICKKPIISGKSFPYEQAIKSGWNGFLLDNNINDWINTIKDLTKNSELRESIVKNAYNDVTQNFMLKNAADNMYKVLTKIIKNKKIKPKKNYDKIKKPSIMIDTANERGETVLGELFGNKRITQDFTCKKDGLYKFQFKAATYMRVNRGELRIQILTEDTNPNSILRSVDISCTNLHDNSWFEVSFEPIKNSANKKYYIVIKGMNCRAGSAVTLYYSTHVHNVGDLKVNRTVFKGCLAMRTYSKN